MNPPSYEVSQSTQGSAQQHRRAQTGDPYRLADKSQRQRLEVSCTRDPIVPIIETPQAVVVLATPVRAASKNGSPTTSMVMASSAPLLVLAIIASTNPAVRPPNRIGRHCKR